MKIVYNRILPFKGFKGINIFGFLFVHKSARVSFTDINHEAIHTEQMKELAYIGFYVLYLLEWLYRLLFHTKTAYKGISFEVEAYCHEGEERYIDTRKHFAQWRKI